MCFCSNRKPNFHSHVFFVVVVVCQTPKSFTSNGFDPLRTLLYNFEWNCSNRTIYLIIICGNMFVRLWIIATDSPPKPISETPKHCSVQLTSFFSLKPTKPFILVWVLFSCCCVFLLLFLLFIQTESNAFTAYNQISFLRARDDLTQQNEMLMHRLFMFFLFFLVIEKANNPLFLSLQIE